MSTATTSPVATALLACLAATPVVHLGRLRDTLGMYLPTYDEAVIALADEGHISLYVDCDPAAYSSEEVSTWVLDPDNGKRYATATLRA